MTKLRPRAKAVATGATTVNSRPEKDNSEDERVSSMRSAPEISWRWWPSDAVSMSEQNIDPGLEGGELMSGDPLARDLWM